MKVNLIIIAVLSVLLFFGCKKDVEEVEIPTQFLGDFELLNSSIEQFPYSDSIRNFTYLDKNGNEFEGNTQAISKIIVTTKTIRYYEYSMKPYYIEYGTQKLQTILMLPDQGKTIEIKAQVSLEVKENEKPRIADILSISEIGKSALNSYVIIPIDERSREGEFTEAKFPQESIKINGNSYSNVYTIAKEKTIIFFNFEKGIVGFKDVKTEKVYSLK